MKLLASIGQSYKYGNDDLTRIIDDVIGLLQADASTRSVIARKVSGILPVSLDISNGYYLSGLFDANNGYDLPSNTRSDEDLNFRHNLRMWTDIYR